MQDMLTQLKPTDQSIKMTLKVPGPKTQRTGRVNSQGFGEEAMVTIAAANGLIPTLPNSNNGRYDKKPT